MAQTASDVLVERLIDWGVDTVFGLPGDGINGFMEALRKAQDRVRFIHVRHEEVAALAASAYAKFTGRLGVCMSTAAPGAVHLLNGLYDAKVDQAPVLAITGMTYHDLIGTNYLQDINQDYLFQDVALFNQRIMGPAHVENMADQACRTALSHRAVAHLAIPIDWQAAEASSARYSMKNVKSHTSENFQRPRRVPIRADLEAAAALLGDKHKIAIVAGAGARGAGAELEELAEKLGAPITKPMLGKECVPDDSPYTTGSIGIVGTRPSAEAMEGCDALIIVGSSFPYIEYLPTPGQAVAVQIDDKPERIGLRYPVDIGLVGDAQATLRELLPLLARNDDRAFLEQAQAGMREWWSLMEERGTRQDMPMKPQVVTWNLSQVLRDDAIITGDSGTVTTWAARMKLRRGQRFSFSGTMCSMAAGLPYAIGAQVAYPNRQVVAFTGDGSLSMMLGDFVTCVQYNLPIKVVVIKNNTLGLIKWEQMVFLGNPEYGVTLAPIDFVKFAEACGARGVHIENPAGCRQQLAEALNMDGPAIIEAVVDPYEPPLPPKITRVQAKHMAEALVRGEPNRERIGLSLYRNMMTESMYATSPYGVVERLKDKAAGMLGGDGSKEQS
jgi:pyruvate dehydrogenase (quinone)